MDISGGLGNKSHGNSGGLVQYDAFRNFFSREEGAGGGRNISGKRRAQL